MLEEKVKKLEERCEDMETELQEFYNNQIDPEYVYKKLVDLEDRSRKCSLRIDGVVDRKGGAWEHCEVKVQNIFKEELASKTLIERLHITQNEKRAAINQELLFVSFYLKSKRRKYLRT